MLSDIVPTLVDLGDAVSRNLAFSYDNETISFGEETITEMNLLELKRRHPEQVSIRTFSKSKEALNGADWQWMLVGKRHTFRMRVQAKRINTNGALKGIYRQAKTAKKPQIDALMDACKGTRYHPFYCLYSANDHRAIWRADSDSEAENGCLLAHASCVKHLSPGPLSKLEQCCYPWHFLFAPMLFCIKRRIQKGRQDSGARGDRVELATGLPDDEFKHIYELQRAMPETIPWASFPHGPSPFSPFFPVRNYAFTDFLDGIEWVEELPPEVVQQWLCLEDSDKVNLDAEEERERSRDYPSQGLVVVDSRSKTAEET
tara:strand:- start:4980 stop:5927 length:948 start_codon:yes stop_codon:yes gene_type:complete